MLYSIIFGKIGLPDHILSTCSDFDEKNRLNEKIYQQLFSQQLESDYLQLAVIILYDVTMKLSTCTSVAPAIEILYDKL